MSFRLPEPIVDALLDKLGNDDEFRALFATNARAALGTLGFAPALDDEIQRGIWNCMTVTELAGKDTIRSSHALIRQQLVAQRAAQMPITLQMSPARRHAA